MGFWHPRSRQRGGNSGWRNRRAERFATPTVRCKLGTVVDMSASGLRLACDAKPPVTVGQTYPTRISFDDGAMPVTVQVRWIKRRGLRRYELGLQFVGLKPGADLVLDAVAKFGMASAAKGKNGGGGAQSRAKPGKAARLHADLPDYYAALGLKPGADDTQIKTSYRKLAVACHPDRCKEPDAMERFEKLHEAYQVLSDRKRRDAYLAMRD